MPKIHRLREGEPPGENTVVAERSWEWCREQLGRLTYMTSLDRLPVLEHEGGEKRPSIAAIRGREFVVAELEAKQGAYRAGYYKSSLKGKQLEEQLKKG